MFLAHGRDAAHRNRHIVGDPASAAYNQKPISKPFIPMKQHADGREYVLDEHTRVLALQLLDRNLHFLGRQVPTENGRSRQVPSVARVTSDEKVVPVEEAEGGEATTICGAGKCVSTGRTHRRGKHARPDQLVHSAPLVCCMSWRYERAIRRQQVVHARERDEVHR